MVSLKFPLSSVKLPALVPLIVTETEGTVSLFELFRTVPEIVVWALAAMVNNKSKDKAARQRGHLLIAWSFYGYRAKYDL